MILKVPSFSRVVIYLALAIMGGMLLTVGFWSAENAKVLVINNEPVPVKPPTVEAEAGIIFLTLDYCKNVNATGKVDLELNGARGSKIAVNWPDDKTPKGCVKADIPVFIPAQTPTDTYYAEFTVVYDVNPLKSAVPITFRSQTFKVVNKTLQPGDAVPVVK